VIAWQSSFFDVFRADFASDRRLFGAYRESVGIGVIALGIFRFRKSEISLIKILAELRALWVNTLGAVEFLVA
jgi:hypothetical protein